MAMNKFYVSQIILESMFQNGKQAEMETDGQDLLAGIKLHHFFNSKTVKTRFRSKKFSFIAQLGHYNRLMHSLRIYHKQKKAASRPPLKKYRN
jgi:hypothetical protein